MTTAIDLSQLPAPQIVEPLNYEILLAERKAAFVALYPAAEQAAIAARLALESEPLTKLLEENTYRELLLRQRINEACQGVMLAYAAGSDLDQLGANLDLERLVIDPGDANAVPPRPAVYESDADFRRRIQLHPEGYTTAGSEGGYVFHALGADADVRDAQATSPAPGNVVVYVMSRTAAGNASEQLLGAVAAALNAETVRPMTDQVSVQSVSVVAYSVEAELIMLPGPDAETVLQAAIEAATAYAESLRRIGHDVPLSGLYAALHQPGVQRVNLTAPAANVVIGQGEVSHCTGLAISLGALPDV